MVKQLTTIQEALATYDEEIYGEHIEVFLVSKRTAINDLGELAAHGLLVMEGAGRATRYRLAGPDA